MCAAQKGYEEVVDVLLKNHATVDIKKNVGYQCPRYKYSTKDYVSSLNPQCCSQDGTRALTIASCQGHAPVVKKLLNAGAHPDLENKVSELPTELNNSADMSHVYCNMQCILRRLRLFYYSHYQRLFMHLINLITFTNKENFDNCIAASDGLYIAF